MTIFIMALEPLDTRYTGQWFNGLPAALQSWAGKWGKTVDIENIAGEQVEATVTQGAFLNFTATNIWKNTQLNTMAQKFANGEVKAGDHVLFTDAWHTGVQQIKYMSELLDIPVKIHSMWHAGSYDPQDFLGRKIKDKRWSLSFERSVFHASDYNYFATEFHINMFIDNVLGPDARFMGNLTHELSRKIIRSGQPHNVLTAELAKFTGREKKRRILFPHRVAPEKQPEIFRDLQAQMPDVEFVICQDKKLTKDEYHELLATSAIVFSANLQETLGISAMEAVLVGTIPVLPNRLSYTEMYADDFLYPSEWTADWDSYLANRDKLIGRLYEILDNPDAFTNLLVFQHEKLSVEYLDCSSMATMLLDAN